MITTILNDQKKSVGYLSNFLKESKLQLSLTLITLAALLWRLYAFVRWMERPGDGPYKAIKAYNWSQSPHFEWHGIWLPGFEYLTGAFSFIVQDPLISIRVLNWAVGLFTVPVFYLLVRRIYGHISGLIVSFILAFLPVHVSLSVTSHTEATFLFEVIAGLFLLIKGTDEGSYRKLCIITSVFLICLATMTRYEAWLLIPFFPLYYFLKTRNWLESGFIFIILCLFPIAWSVGNYIHSGDFLLGFIAATDPDWAKEGSNLPITIKTVGRHTVQQIEWTLIIMASCGLIMQVVQIVKKNSSAEKVFYLLITLFYWCVMFKFAISRGETLQTRNLLFCIVLLLPFIATPLVYYFKGDHRMLSVFFCFTVVAFMIPKIAVYYPINDLTVKRPLEIKKLASWLEHSSYRNQPVLMTWIGEQPSYLPLYFPDIGAHDHGYFILRRGQSVSRLEKYLKNRQPSLLITCDADDKFISQIEELLGKKFDLSHPVYSVAHIKVYDIKYVFGN